MAAVPTPAPADAPPAGSLVCRGTVQTRWPWARRRQGGRYISTQPQHRSNSDGARATRDATVLVPCAAYMGYACTVLFLLAQPLAASRTNHIAATAKAGRGRWRRMTTISRSPLFCQKDNDNKALDFPMVESDSQHKQAWRREGETAGGGVFRMALWHLAAVPCQSVSPRGRERHGTRGDTPSGYAPLIVSHRESRADVPGPRRVHVLAPRLTTEAIRSRTVTMSTQKGE